MVAPIRGAHPERMSGLFAVGGAQSNTSLAIGDHAADWEDTAGAEFHALLLERDLCSPATIPDSHNDPRSGQARQNVVFQNSAAQN